MASSKLYKYNCKFWIGETREKIFSLGNNPWVVYSIGIIATMCSQRLDRFPLYELTQAKLSQFSLSVAFEPCTMSAQLAILRTLWSTPPGWTGQWHCCSSLITQTEIENIMKDIRAKISGEYDANKLIQRLDDLKVLTQFNHWFFITPAVTIGFYFSYNYCNHSMEKVLRNCISNSNRHSNYHASCHSRYIYPSSKPGQITAGCH